MLGGAVVGLEREERRGDETYDVSEDADLET